MTNNTKLIYLNLLNDFIIKKIPKEEISIIKIIDVDNFLIFKGSTTLLEPLNLFSITDEFKKYYDLPEDIKLNTIDLIKYGMEDFDIFESPIIISSRNNLN